MLEYALAYVKERKGLQKHVMRYPQIFATKANERTLDDGIKMGVIWHTQGVGKTALAYYNVKYLSNYFEQKNVIAKKRKSKQETLKFELLRSLLIAHIALLTILSIP